MQDIGFKIQSLRQLLRWSQRELSKRAEVPNSTVSMIEQGKVSPNLETLRKISLAFGIPEHCFFTISREPCVKLLNLEDFPEAGLKLGRGLLKCLTVNHTEYGIDDISVTDNVCGFLDVAEGADVYTRAGHVRVQGSCGLMLGAHEPYQLVCQENSRVLVFV